MELVAFILLFILGVITILMENRDIFRFVYLPSVVIFMLIVRLNAFVFNSFELDILTYAIEMKTTSFHVYYLREFVFWLGIRLVYYVTHSDLGAFIIMDILWIYLLYKASLKEKYYKLNNGLLIILVTSFPFLFGYENIYRQFYATVILLLAYSRLERKNYFPWILILVSIFTHNLALFILPLFIAKRFFSFNDFDRLIISTSLSFLYVIGLPYFMGAKTISDTGGIDLSVLYIVLFLIVFCFFVFRFRKNVLLFTRLLPSIIPITLVTVGFIYLQQELITERVGMMFIAFLLFDLYNLSNQLQNYSYRAGLRLFLLLVFTLPVFLSSSSLKFLM